MCRQIKIIYSLCWCTFYKSGRILHFRLILMCTFFAYRIESDNCHFDYMKHFKVTSKDK